MTTFLPVDVERLAGKADGDHRAIGIDPPAIAISRRPVAIGFGIEHEGRAVRRSIQSGGKHGRAIDDAVAQQEDTEAAEIPQRDAGAAAADFLPGVGFQRIERVELHAEAGPDRLRHVVGQLFSRSRRDQAAENVGIAGVVVEVTAGPMFGFQAPHQRQHAARNLVAERFAVAIHVGIPVGVILVPAHARRHGDQAANGHRVVGTAAQRRDIFRHRVVEARDRALLQRGPDQRRRQRLDHRHRRPAHVLLQPEGVTLQNDLFLPDDEQPRDVGAIDIRVDAMHLLAGLIARRNLPAACQLQNRLAAADRSRREHPIHIPVGVGLRRRRKQQKVLTRRDVQFWIRDGSCHAMLSHSITTALKPSRCAEYNDPKSSRPRIPGIRAAPPAHARPSGSTRRSSGLSKVRTGFRRRPDRSQARHPWWLPSARRW